jgi:hypothetical protein
MEMENKVAEIRNAGWSGLRIARRDMSTSSVASPLSGDSPAPSITARNLRTVLPEASHPGEPLPIWLSALIATACEARRNGKIHAVNWSMVAGRAVYTNSGGEAEHIEPLGISLLGGHTMAVYWMPGDTAYTVEVYRQKERCA